MNADKRKSSEDRPSHRHWTSGNTPPSARDGLAARHTVTASVIKHLLHPLCCSGIIRNTADDRRLGRDDQGMAPAAEGPLTGLESQKVHVKQAEKYCQAAELGGLRSPQFPHKEHTDLGRSETMLRTGHGNHELRRHPGTEAPQRLAVALGAAHSLLCWGSDCTVF